jgi:hypothetical protein
MHIVFLVLFRYLNYQETEHVVDKVYILFQCASVWNIYLQKKAIQN